MKKTVLIIVLLAICSAPLFGASGTGVDPSRNLFNARQLGMGGISTNFADDANGIFANPAALCGLEFPQLTSSSRKLMLDETQYLLTGWTMPTDYGTFGLGYVGMGTTGSLPTTLDPSSGRIIINPSLEAGSYANSTLAVSFSRSLQAPIRIDLGANLKLFNQALSGGGVADRGTGYGIDLGATFKPYPWLATSAVLQNLLGGSINWANSEDRLGGYYKIGAAANLLGSSSEALRDSAQQLKAALDLDLPNGVLASSNTMLYHLGLEYVPLKNVFLRAGLNQETAGSGLTFGVGFINSGFRFDYAYVQRAGLPGDNPHYFSLSYIGERALTVAYPLKSKLAHLKFLSPHDRLITDRETIEVRAEAWADKVIDRIRTWTVTGISATQETIEFTSAESLAQLYLNGKPLAISGTVETEEKLGVGRNVFSLVGYVTPDAKVPSAHGSAEVKVLRVVPYQDVPMHDWAFEPIALTSVMGLVKGYPNNIFKPEKGITRAELVTLLVRSLGIPAETLDLLASEGSFRDVKSSNWAAKYVAKGVKAGFVNGYPDGSFKPHKVLSRAEAVTIFARYAALAEEPNITAAPFADLKPDFWANKFIAPAKAAGLLKYLEAKKFEPHKHFTRAEACEVLYHVPAIQKEVEQFWIRGVVSAL